MSSSSLNDHERVGIVRWANVVGLDACEPPVGVGGVKRLPDSVSKVCRARNRRKENVNDARSFALLVAAGSRHDVGHVFGVGVRLVVLRARDACLVHLLGDGIVRNVSVVVVDLFKEEKERRHGGVSNDDREGGREEGGEGGEAIAPLAKWPK